MIQGKSELNLDAKGRLAIPAKYREQLGDAAPYRVVVTPNFGDRCLLLYPAAAWATTADEVAKLPPLNPLNRKLQRLILGNASDLELDAQGRILLPATLREYAGLDRRVVLAGQGHRFEIWDETAWEQTMEDINGDIADPESALSASLMSLRI